jgi:hypothetical protein
VKNFQFTSIYTFRDGRQVEGRAHANGMKTLLGLPYKAKLPKEGMEPRVIQGVKVWVTPFVPKMGIDRWSGKIVKIKSSTHRVMAECPDCGMHLSAGRLHQHVCKES